MKFIDFHSHLVPGVDDGAQSIDESCFALTSFAEHDVSVVVTTPHVDGSLTLDRRLLDERLGELDRGWAVLATHAAAHHPDMTVLRGVELMIDTPEPVLTDRRLRLNEGTFVLVEFPFMSVPPRSAEVLKYVRERGVVPILAHPERYMGFDPSNGLAAQWRASGAVLAVNGPSLLGRYGREARAYALGLLEAGLCGCLCSDYHSRGTPLVRDYYDFLIEAGGQEQAGLLMEVNPRRILKGEEPLPVPPLKLKKTVWTQLGTFFRSR